MTAAIKVTFQWYSGKEMKDESYSALLPADWVWSAEGMAKIYNVGRAFLADPAQYPESEDIQECWESFHFIAIDYGVTEFIHAPFEKENEEHV